MHGQKLFHIPDVANLYSSFRQSVVIFNSNDFGKGRRQGRRNTFALRLRLHARSHTLSSTNSCASICVSALPKQNTSFKSFTLNLMISWALHFSMTALQCIYRKWGFLKVCCMHPPIQLLEPEEKNDTNYRF